MIPLHSPRILLSWLLAILISNAPSLILANEALHRSQEMIPTRVALEDFSRGEAEQEIGKFLERADVETQLLKQGISPKEISSRLAGLSEREIRQLSMQVKEVRAGGDILFSILIVLLIIFLAKRI